MELNRVISENRALSGGINRVGNKFENSFDCTQNAYVSGANFHYITNLNYNVISNKALLNKRLYIL